MAKVRIAIIILLNIPSEHASERNELELHNCLEARLQTGTERTYIEKRSVQRLERQRLIRWRAPAPRCDFRRRRKWSTICSSYFSPVACSPVWRCPRKGTRARKPTSSLAGHECKSWSPKPNADSDSTKPIFLFGSYLQRPQYSLQLQLASCMHDDRWQWCGRTCAGTVRPSCPYSANKQLSWTAIAFH